MSKQSYHGLSKDDYQTPLEALRGLRSLYSPLPAPTNEKDLYPQNLYIYLDSINNSLAKILANIGQFSPNYELLTEVLNFYYIFFLSLDKPTKNVEGEVEGEFVKSCFYAFKLIDDQSNEESPQKQILKEYFWNNCFSSAHNLCSTIYKKDFLEINGSEFANYGTSSLKTLKDFGSQTYAPNSVLADEELQLAILMSLTEVGRKPIELSPSLENSVQSIKTLCLLSLEESAKLKFAKAAKEFFIKNDKNLKCYLPFFSLIGDFFFKLEKSEFVSTIIIDLQNRINIQKLVEKQTQEISGSTTNYLDELD